MLSNTELNQHTDEIERMSRDEFFADYPKHDSPVILTDEVQRWPAFKLWNPSYLKEKLADKQVEVAISSSDVFSYRRDKAVYSNETMPFGSAMDHIEQPNGRHYYIMQKSLHESFPEIESDIRVPEGIGDCEVTTNVWIGSKGNLTPLHFDPSDNFMGQIYGEKELLLFSPSEKETLYPNSITEDFSHISKIDIDAPDLTQYPLYKNAKALLVTLRAGEMLFLPSHWWHAVRSKSPNAMVNSWIPSSNLDTFLSKPTGIHSLWFLYKSTILQSLAGLIKKSESSYHACAVKLLDVKPGAAVLMAHAGVIHALLMAASNDAQSRPVEELNDCLASLQRSGVVSSEDLNMLQAMRFAALQTFTDSDFDRATAETLVSQMQEFAARIYSARQ